jgi:hypothetical protein
MLETKTLSSSFLNALVYYICAGVVNLKVIGMAPAVIAIVSKFGGWVTSAFFG